MRRMTTVVDRRPARRMIGIAVREPVQLVRSCGRLVSVSGGGVSVQSGEVAAFCLQRDVVLLLSAS